MNQKIKMAMTVIFLVAVIGGAAWFYQHQNQPAKTPSQDDISELVMAPDFNVQNEEGKNTYLYDFKDGKPIIINFWASTCQPCQMEMPDLMNLYEKYQNDVHFMMIDCVGSLGETKEKAKTFLKEHQYTFPVYYDVNKNATSTYGVMSFPTTYILNKKGEVYAGGTGMIDASKVEEIFKTLISE